MIFWKKENSLVPLLKDVLKWWRKDPFLNTIALWFFVSVGSCTINEARQTWYAVDTRPRLESEQTTDERKETQSPEVEGKSIQ